MKKFLPVLLIVGVIFLATKKTSGQMSFSKSGDKGIRNNNPGNIRISNANWKGKVPLSENTDGQFEQFTDMKWGARAMVDLLKNYIEDDGANTISKIITRYAPAKDSNNTAGYIAYVQKETGYGNSVISTQYPDAVASVAAVMSWVENGKDDALKAGLTPQFFRSAWDLI